MRINDWKSHLASQVVTCRINSGNINRIAKFRISEKCEFSGEFMEFNLYESLHDH